jgi:hypothetical protein
MAPTAAPAIAPKGMPMGPAMAVPAMILALTPCAAPAISFVIAHLLSRVALASRVAFVSDRCNAGSFGRRRGGNRRAASIAPGGDCGHTTYNAPEARDERQRHASGPTAAAPYSRGGTSCGAAFDVD